PGLAAGDVEVFVVGEALLAYRGGAAAGPGGVAYLVVRRQGVNGGAAQRVGYGRRAADRRMAPLLQ
ncbi:hypothetical protein, partial [Lelliottia aquatilis]|uniref:hypothetical protein n=1 Tax=Lelliottia aquatilis TaxID=2080838 RepID=UPI0015766040